MRNARISLCLIAVLLPASVSAEICKHDDSVVERFLPVDLFTGTTWNGEETITLPHVDQSYPYTISYRADEDKVIAKTSTSLKGPMVWASSRTRKSYNVYDRVVNSSRGAVAERMTIIADGTALGRVTDGELERRDAEFENEGKYPIGKWKQGQKKTYDRLVISKTKTVPSPTSIKIEKLSCVFDGVPESVQIRWSDERRSNSYIFVPGRGMSHVIVNQ